MLPCSSQKKDLKHGRLIARKLKIQAKAVDLTPAYKACIKVLPRSNKISCGNLKARLRMLALYYFANKLNYLVCGTSNKSERLTGYFTKYGDGAADILPLGNLLKSEVRKLAADLSLPQEIINRAPTAGFWPGQTDEKDLGISYDSLDDVLSGACLRRQRAQPPSLINNVRKRIKASEHKRQLPKICRVK
jgi:NAD+ synthase